MPSPSLAHNRALRCREVTEAVRSLGMAEASDIAELLGLPHGNSVSSQLTMLVSRGVLETVIVKKRCGQKRNVYMLAVDRPLNQNHVGPKLAMCPVVNSNTPAVPPIVEKLRLAEAPTSMATILDLCVRRPAYPDLREVS